ncbi:hypothetical protein RRG08_064383 [Elysia crispata]|uniref:Uncharacterized protein n=1 Tax=Elysia crispata TaxID=231223 RepID=A0AAE0YFL8_9GAST|nr:hypothetical protein RRG08_064383 [Elysia crispata]
MDFVAFLPSARVSTVKARRTSSKPGLERLKQVVVESLMSTTPLKMVVDVESHMSATPVRVVVDVESIMSTTPLRMVVDVESLMSTTPLRMVVDVESHVNNSFESGS